MSANEVLAVMSLLLFTVPVASFLVGYNAGRKVTFPPAAKPPKCHQWSKWRPTEVIRILFGKDQPPEAGQYRTCDLCGKTEIRWLGGA